MAANTVTIVVPVAGMPYRTTQTAENTISKMVGGYVTISGREQILHPAFTQYEEWNTINKIFLKVKAGKMKVKTYLNENGMNECTQNMAVFTHDKFGTSPIWGNLVLTMTKKQADKVSEIASLPWFKDEAAYETAYEEE